MSREIELVAANEHEGARLDAVLGGHPEVGSRAAAQRLIEAGRVSVDGKARPKRHALGAGARVHALLPDPAPPPDLDDATAGAAYAVAYEDEHLIVVDKPAGVVVHPGAGHRSGTLVQALAAHGAAGGERWRPGIVHRLDRDTSGLLVVAKSERVHRALERAIRTRAVRREYLALVAGRPDTASGTIDAVLGRDRADRTRVSIQTDRPRAARTHFQVEEELAFATLLRVRLETGRTHQIRAHMAAIGLPVCGDPRYGGLPCGRRLALGRQFLHSTRLELPHPEHGEALACASPLPADLARALDAAREPPSSLSSRRL